MNTIEEKILNLLKKEKTLSVEEAIICLNNVAGELKNLEKKYQVEVKMDNLKSD